MKSNKLNAVNWFKQKRARKAALKSSCPSNVQSVWNICAFWDGKVCSFGHVDIFIAKSAQIGLFRTNQCWLHALCAGTL
jgi:hypothetical protein